MRVPRGLYRRAATSEIESSPETRSAVYDCSDARIAELSWLWLFCCEDEPLEPPPVTAAMLGGGRSTAWVVGCSPTWPEPTITCTPTDGTPFTTTKRTESRRQ